MAKTLTKKLRDSGLATPESDRITQVAAREKRRPKAHKHRWFTPEGSSVQYCRGRSCDAHRLAES